MLPLILKTPKANGTLCAEEFPMGREPFPVAGFGQPVDNRFMANRV